MSDDIEAGQRADRSAIGFPYVDLDGAIEVAKKMLDAGGVPLDRDQLGAALNIAPASGNFSIKLGAARMFGLVETVSGKHALTPLGFEILDEKRVRAAKAQAFLNVPLYKRVYDDFRGKQLPPRPLGLETAFVNFGVAPKQKDKARHVFDRSARSAGFFPNGNEERLVQPPIANGHSQDDGGSSEKPDAGQAPPQSPLQPPPREYAAPPPVIQKHHLMVQGLLERLPPVDEVWPAAKRAKWLEAAARIFDVIYEGDGGTVRIIAEPAKE